MSLFFFANNFYKTKETLKNFSRQLLDVYKILLVETTLELMFYYTFSVINVMFVPCTALLYDSKAATWTLKLSTTLLTKFLWNPYDFSSDDVLSCLWIVFTNSFFQVPPLENGQAGWDLGNKMARGYWFDAKWVCPIGSYA